MLGELGWTVSQMEMSGRDAKGDDEKILCWEIHGSLTGRGCVSSRGRKELRSVWTHGNEVRRAGCQGLEANTDWTLSLQVRKAS